MKQCSKILKLPEIIGHRGAIGHWKIPENTCESVIKAYQLGAGGVEFDIQMTKDKQFVIYHDHILDTVSNGFGSIHKMNLHEITKLKLNSIMDNNIYHIPSISDIMKITTKLNLFANIEIKSYCDSYDYDKELVHYLTKYLLDNHSINLSRILVSSFSPRIINLLDSHSKINYAPIDCNYNQLISLPSAFVYHASHLNKSKISMTKKLNRPLIVYNVFGKQHAAKLFELGASSVIVDIF